MNPDFLWAILVMAVLTYATRALPFVWMQKSEKLKRLGSGKFAILGPALLACTSGVILFSETKAAYGEERLLPYCLALLTVIAVVLWKRNMGLAMLLSLIVYGLALQ